MLEKPSSGRRATTHTTVTSGQNLEEQLVLGRVATLGTSRDNTSRLTSVEATRLLDAGKLEELDRRTELNNIASDEISNLKKQHERLSREAREDLRACREELEREREAMSTLKATMSHQSDSDLTLAAENTALKARDEARQSQMDADTQQIAELTRKLQEERQKNVALNWEAMRNEALRRKLHNTIQELKGNIRVFCRVRPVLPSDLSETSMMSTSTEDAKKLQEDMTANMIFPDHCDHKEIVLRSSSKSATGQERIGSYAFSFDRVFEPGSTQAQVFEEISLLAQSCIDGYNVCIFAYGQTGSGKSYTMEGGSTDTTKGMIPRAVEQVFRETERLKEKGWEYQIKGQFLEIASYNETIKDLFGKGEIDKKSEVKHEIKHDETGSTRVTDITVVDLHSPFQVKTLLASGQDRRSVATTLMNDCSSRSHSVFTLRLSGTNTSTGESCKGCLNLVDLAGSERITTSGTGTGGRGNDRLKETQNINRSLSALGDVIAALGERANGGDQHIPYRNSKLTYLLQESLTRDSKTLMILNLSPLTRHSNESLTALRFATKVNNTTLGTAKKRVRRS
ncbi:kinesin-domain-containing protein [Dendrothele bispora CBS 962.96]|uniref:Kinesin-domain-containing protein n=1 Tax=Dendrothele bispora (strain CBS 962.96) TaxID=1314807 RepID=A0A4S8MNU6_DENBC|nr:kinesin-domain-containing protein [Dendrothele bispora CBS 962.96]